MRKPIVTAAIAVILSISPVITVRISVSSLTHTSPYHPSPLRLSTNESSSSNESTAPPPPSPPPKLNRRQRKRALRSLDYANRRLMWTSRYGSLSALQSTFGTGPLFGDLSPSQTRRLYHTLLPRSLLGLYEMEVMNPEELAPLAFQARVAAKDYARSRCVWSGRLVTAAFDQWRNVRDNGRVIWGKSSMTWDEIWDKYEAQIMEEENAANRTADGAGGVPTTAAQGNWGGWRRGRMKRGEDNDSVTMRIYRRILERSCETNEAFDSLFLKDMADDDDDSDRLAGISAKLEEDVLMLLRPKESVSILRRQQKAEKAERKAKEKQEKAQRKKQEKEKKAERKAIKKEKKLLIHAQEQQDAAERKRKKEEEKKQKSARKGGKH